LRRLQLVIAALAVLAPAAHVLEMPNKLTLDGALWVGIQQHLYRGWGPFIGAPLEVAGLVVSLTLAVRDRSQRGLAWANGIAAAAYAGMIAVFFVFNAPVNQAVSHLTTATLPADWQTLRRQWETGHAIAAVLSVVALGAVIRARSQARA
jgi:hypothetical protein